MLTARSPEQTAPRRTPASGSKILVARVARRSRGGWALQLRCSPDETRSGVRGAHRQESVHLPVIGELDRPRILTRERGVVSMAPETGGAIHDPRLHLDRQREGL